MSSEGQDITVVGTGVLISPNLVLTAAHNIYNDSQGNLKEYQKFLFLLGANGEVSKKQYQQIIFWRYEKAANPNDTTERIKNDYALLLLV
jgi:V8-like Glu-specific endopeptidase